MRPDLFDFLRINAQAQQHFRLILEATGIAQLGENRHQLQAHVHACRVPGNGFVQHVAGVAVATIGDVDVRAFQTIGAGGRQFHHGRTTRCRGCCLGSRHGVHHLQGVIQIFFVELGSRKLGLGRHVVRFFGFPAARQQQAAKQRQQPADHHPSPAGTFRRGIGCSNRGDDRSLLHRRRRHSCGCRLCLGVVFLAALQLRLQLLDLPVTVLQRLQHAAQLLFHAVQPRTQAGALVGEFGQFGIGIADGGCSDRRRWCGGCHRCSRRDSFGARRGLGRGHGGLCGLHRRLGACGENQGLAGLQAMRIAIDEGLRIELVDAVHQLRVRGAAGAHARSDAPQGVVPDRGVAPFSRGNRLACHGHRTRRSLAPHARLGGDGGGNVALGRTRHASRRIAGRIEQHGVFAHQAAIGAFHLEQEAHVGFAHRLRRAHLDVTAAAADHRGEAQILEGHEALDTGLLKGSVAGQMGNQFVGAEIADLEQFDIGIEGLVEGRVHGDFTETQGISVAGDGHRQCSKC
ncbi:hypothetical protein D3C76_682320 [compost metagenome]